MPLINISDVVKNLIIAVTAELKLIISNTLPLAVAAEGKYLTNLETRGTALLQTIADPTFTGDKLAFCLARLKDEQPILESEVFSFIIIGEGAAQNIINSIQNILISAVQSILPVTP
jgi:hypothetical protein